MKVFPVSEIRHMDAYTIAHEPIASIDLMERAAAACTQWLSEHFTADRLFVVFCGQGNNGGDGLAIARQLNNLNFSVHVVMLEFGDNWSADCQKNFSLLQQFSRIRLTRLRPGEPVPLIGTDDVVIDCIFGSGLNRPVSGPSADVITQINTYSQCTISIDLPSGLFGEDNTANDFQNIIRAKYTLSFQFPKLSFFFASNEIFTGEWLVLDIGLHKAVIENTHSEIHYFEAADARSLRRKRSRFSHKGSFGHALLLAGSRGMAGAALLSGEACLRAGCGLVTIHCPHSLEPIIQAGLREAILSLDPSPDVLSILPDLSAYAAIGIGPGLRREQSTVNPVHELLDTCNKPLVIDADALNIIGEHQEFLERLPKNTILTPHPREFERMFGKFSNEYTRWQMQLEMSSKYGIYILLKGAYSCLSTPDGHSWFNSTGNPGMATAGTGDVLTGLITGLLASGYPVNDAALLGMWIHGSAGDIAVQKSSEESMVATDLLKETGAAFSLLD